MATITKIFATTGLQNFTLPADFSAPWSFHAIGAGSSGGRSASGGGGGGGGAWARITDADIPTLVGGTSIEIFVGAAPSTGSLAAGEDSYVNVVGTGAPASIAQGVLANGAPFGVTGTTPSTGGQASASIGSSRTSGGAGGTPNTGSGGGGGAGGPGGAGGIGGNSAPGSNRQGGGGGAATDVGAGAAGQAGQTNNGGLGGASGSGVSGGAGATSSAPAGNGSLGSGGGGGYTSANVGGRGGAGNLWTDSVTSAVAGPGGGSGGNGTTNTTRPLGYGGAGGGNNASATTPGAQGVVVLVYSDGVTARLNQTLGPVTLAATGTVGTSATLNQTLGPVVLTATGMVGLIAHLNQTLGPVTLAGAGDVPVSGGVQQTLGAVTLAASANAVDGPGSGLQEAFPGETPPNDGSWLRVPGVLVVPLHAVPYQTVVVTLAGQRCRIEVYQKEIGVRTGPNTVAILTPVFLNLYVNDALVIGGVICENRNAIVRDAYLGFAGDLAFIDTQRSDDPVYPGIGERWVLAYFPNGEIP